MKYQHQFTIRASLNKVIDFHQQSSNMAAITPSLVPLKIHVAPTVLHPGDEMDFTMWLGPLPVRWLARIEPLEPDPNHPAGASLTPSTEGGFIDRQVKGPFTNWVHHHRFVALNEQTTIVFDTVEATLRQHPLWSVVGLSMFLGLPMLFAFRDWKTKRILGP